MSTTARLATRNLLRSPRRTVLTAIAIVAGVAVSIVGRGFVEGTSEGIIMGAIEGTVGHVTARPAGYPARPMQRPVDELLHVNEETARLLAEEAEAWTERAYFAPVLAHRGDSLRVSAVGFDPERDETVFPRTHWTVEGEMPRPGAAEVGVSPQVGELLDLAAGDVVVLQVRSHQGAMNALEATVSGVVRSGNLALDMRGVWVPGTLTEELIRAEEPTHLSVRLSDRDDAGAFAARLQQALGPEAEVVTWQGETRELLALQATRTQAVNLVVFVLMALAAFGIANTILMAAHERTREVGTLRALGMSEGGVIRLFLLEGALLGLLGGVVGALVGGGLVVYWNRNPIDFSAVMDSLGAAYAMSPLIYTSFELPVVVVALALGVVVAVLASIYPARVASRMVPAEAVRADG